MKETEPHLSRKEMPHTKMNLRFCRIMTSEVLFYDDAFNEECKLFCEKRNITYLPSKNNPDVCYRLDGSKFKEQKIEESQRVEVTDRIFDNSILDKFRKHHVLFVYSNNKVAGVVHFCDYNRDTVFLKIYPLLLRFERKLRIVLVSHGLNNQDMIAFFKSHSENEYYRAKYEDYLNGRIQKSMRELEPFQAFDLKDLICLFNSKGILKLSEDTCALRNAVMHARNVVKHRNYEIDSLIYDFKSFERFFDIVSGIGSKIKKLSGAIIPSEEKEETAQLREAGLFRQIRS